MPRSSRKSFTKEISFCLHAAERLEKEGGWKVEVIDIRSLIPLDKEAIFESVKKTSKALVVHEDKVFSGFGAELADWTPY